jgi:hypothetical protein
MCFAAIYIWGCLCDAVFDDSAAIATFFSYAAYENAKPINSQKVATRPRFNVLKTFGLYP